MAAAIALGLAAVSLLPRGRPVPPPPLPAAAPARPPTPPAIAARPAPVAVATPPLRPRIAPAEAPRHVASAVHRPPRPEPRPRWPLPVVVASRARAPCPTPRSAADRLVCANPALAAQDRAMHAAYGRALAAGADRLGTDRDQALWRRARERTGDPRQLAQLYARRIADLDTAARHPR
jgi:hypothetical protein